MNQAIKASKIENRNQYQDVNQELGMWLNTSGNVVG